MSKTEPVSTTGLARPSVKRGQIYHIDMGSTAPTGTEIWPGRPGLIVSNDAINEKAGFVTVVYLTTAPKRDMPYHVTVTSGDKLATAMCEQIFSVDKSRLGSLVGEASIDEMTEVDHALRLSTATIGGSREHCTSMFKKWLMALEKHNIDISGNPCTQDEETASSSNSDHRTEIRQKLNECQTAIGEIITSITA